MTKKDFYLDRDYMKIEKITLIQLDPPLPDYFTKGFIIPRYGLVLIGTILKNRGYDVKIFVEHVKKPDWERVMSSDALCFHTVTPAACRTYKMVDEIKSRKPIPTIIGGTFASYFSQATLRHFDFVVHNEGDETIVELLEALKNNGDLTKVLGISYKNNGKIYHNHFRRPVEHFDTIPDYSLIQGYERMGILTPKFRQSYIQFSRGCPYNCKFCMVKKMFGPKYRTKSIDTMIREIKDKLKYGKWLFFIDNNFFGDKVKTKSLLRRIIKERIKAIFTAYACIDIVDDPELLSLMKKAGIEIVIIGIESFNDEVLKYLGKNQTKKEILRAIKILNAHRIGIIGSFVLGSDKETKESIREIADFANRYNFYDICLFILTFQNPDSISPIPENRIFNTDLNYFSGCYACVFPKTIKPSTLQNEIIEAYKAFFSLRQMLRRFLLGRWKSLGYSVFYKHATKPVLKEMKRYLPYLREVEKDMYDENKQLIESRLSRRTFENGETVIANEVKQSRGCLTGLPQIRNSTTIYC